MKKTVHTILGAFLRGLWIGALLFVVMLCTGFIGALLSWPAEQGVTVWGVEMGLAFILWVTWTLHDLTSEKGV